jgi:hypothetical protein
MRRFGRVAQGGKASALSVASGAGVGLVSVYAMSAVPWLGQAWWTMPVALALVGHFLKRKNPALGGALLGVGGYWGYTGFMANRAAATAKGWVDAGWMGGSDAGRYHPGGSDAGAYNDNIGTDAAPALGTAQAAMLLSPGRNTMGFDESAELISDAYGISD